MDIGLKLTLQHWYCLLGSLRLRRRSHGIIELFLRLDVVDIELVIVVFNLVV